MCVKTEVRDSAMVKKSGTTHGKIRQVVKDKEGRLHYIDGGTLKIAHDLDDEHALACLPLHHIPVQLLLLAAAKEIRENGDVILYAKKLGQN